MKVYGSGGLLATITTTTLSNGRRCPTPGADIKDVYFTVDDPEYPTYGLFDNFSYGAGGGTNVPDPGSTLLLFGIGLVG